MICQICKNSEGNRTLKVSEMMFGSKEEFSYIECANCGALQILEVPENLSEYYPLDYCSFKRDIIKLGPISHFFRIRRDKFALFGKSILGRLWYLKFPDKYLRNINKLGIKFRRNPRVLDVGCGSGQFLRRLEEVGFTELIGIDPFLPKNIHEGRIKLLKKTIFELKCQDTFDFINLNHSLEHMPNQVEVLTEISKLLSTNGICLISMPIKTEYIWNRYGVNWYQIDAPRHLVIHTLKSFSYLVEKLNLKIKYFFFNSTPKAFWASEEYEKDIPQNAEQSFAKNPSKSIFSEKQIEEYQKLVKKQNKINQGDQASFYLVKSNVD